MNLKWMEMIKNQAKCLVGKTVLSAMKAPRPKTGAVSWQKKGTLAKTSIFPSPNLLKIPK